MTGILTADIIGSRKRLEDWLEPLKKKLSDYGESPRNWEIYRGDSFQLEIPDAALSLKAAFEIKAILRANRSDARIAIGIGKQTKQAERITEGNGEAFIRSGELFETLKPQKISLAVATGNEAADTQLNLLLRMASVLIDGWLPQSAEFVSMALAFPELSQEELGKRLGVAQAAVSRRRKRANFDLIAETETYFRTVITSLQP